MHPIDIENYNYTYSERVLYYALKEQLPDKIHVFYSVRWFETINDKRVDSECDFLVFDPNFGFITIEVKGGSGIDVKDNKWTIIDKDDNGIETSRLLKCSPFEQSEKSMRHFQNYFFEEFNQSFNGVYGFAAAFPLYVLPQRLSNEAPSDLVIDLSNLQTLQVKINNIFHYWKNNRNLRTPFSQDQKMRFINAINKRIALSAAAGALINIKEREFARINIIQDSIIDALHNYKQAFIVGGAGTGKTWIGMKKVLRAAKNGQCSLFLCYSAELAEFVRDNIPRDVSYDCYTFEQLMKNNLASKYNTLPRNQLGDIVFFDSICDKHLENMYDTIVVDEAQDFTLDMALTSRCFLKNQIESEFYILFDKNQNILCRDFEDGFSIVHPPFILRFNIRNTGSIYEWATLNTGLGTETIANSLHGIAPEYFEFHNHNQAIKQTNNIVNRLVQKEYVSNKSILILSDVPYNRSILFNENQIGPYKLVNKPLHLITDGEICFRTTAEFKGLEANIVVFIQHTPDNFPIGMNDRQNRYVAYTRARYYLYIINTIGHDTSE